MKTVPPSDWTDTSPADRFAFVRSFDGDETSVSLDLHANGPPLVPVLQRVLDEVSNELAQPLGVPQSPGGLLAAQVARPNGSRGS